MTNVLPNPPLENDYYETCYRYFRPGAEQYFVYGSNFNKDK